MDELPDVDSSIMNDGHSNASSTECTTGKLTLGTSVVTERGSTATIAVVAGCVSVFD